MKSGVIYTVGHSRRRLEEFIGILQTAGIERLVDIRCQPHSRRHPYFSRHPLRASLAEAGLEYEWAGPALGGRRASRRGSAHRALRDEGMRGYADHMEGGLFVQAVAALIARSAGERLALMCAEALPEHCHRSLVADYLLVQGGRVLHLLGPGETRAHTLHPAARTDAGRLVYDRNTTCELDI